MNLVAPRFGHDGTAEACQQRTDGEHRPPQCGALAHELVAAQVFQVHLVGLEGIAALAAGCHLHVDVAQQLDQVVHVEDVGNVADLHLVAREQRGRDHLQGFVLGSLRRYLSFEQVPAFDDK